MTIENRAGLQDGPDDERCVDALLTESGFPDDVELRDVLLQLRRLRAVEVPPPSAELAALLRAPWSANVIPLEPGRPRKKKRIVFTTLAVAASLGVAGGAAAGDEALRRGAEGTISTIVRSFSPPAPPSPAPAVPADAATQPPAVVPVSGETAPEAGPGSLPAAPAPAAAPASVAWLAPALAEPPATGLQEIPDASGPAGLADSGAAGPVIPGPAGSHADASAHNSTPAARPTTAPQHQAPSAAGSAGVAGAGNPKGKANSRGGGQDTEPAMAEPRGNPNTAR